MELFAPASYISAPPAMRARLCNGCGTKGLGGWLVPDTLYGLSITPACDIHDWMYHIGLTIEDKESADRAMLNNMIRIIHANPCRFLDIPRKIRAKNYYNAVKWFGGPAYWSGKNKSTELIQA